MEFKISKITNWGPGILVKTNLVFSKALQKLYKLLNKYNSATMI